MRKIDKKLNMMKANLLAEQRYLESKGLISETILPLSDGKFAFAEGVDKESIKDDIRDELEADGVNTDEVGEVILKTPKGEVVDKINLDDNLEEGNVKNFVWSCVIGATGLLAGSCNKENTTFSFNSSVHGVEYEIDNNKGTEEIEVVNFNGEIKKYKVVKVKDQRGNASSGVALKQKPTEFELAIFSFGKTLQEEERSNRSSNNGETVVDYSIEKPTLNVGYTASPAKNIKELNSFKKAMNFIENGDSKYNVAEAKAIFNQEMEKARAKGVFSEPKDVDYADYATSNY